MNLPVISFWFIKLFTILISIIARQQYFVQTHTEDAFEWDSVWLTAKDTPNGSLLINSILIAEKEEIFISTENFSVALEPLISSLDPRVKTYIMGDFNINLLDHNRSPPVENFINQMISKIFLPIINRPTRVTPIVAP